MSLYFVRVRYFIMETLLLIIIGISVLGIIYWIYQFARDQKVYEIRQDWIITDNPKKDKYTYDYMFNPSFRNWLGLKFPSKSDF